MNFRSKWLVGTIRTLLGLLMIMTGIMGLYFAYVGAYPEVSGATDATRLAEAGLAAAGMILVVKVIELVAGLMLLVNFRPAFAAILLAPLSVAIMTYDLALWTHVPSSLVPAGFMFVANVYLGYVYWGKYKAIFTK